MTSTDLMKPTYAKNMKIIGHTDMGGGRADGVQIMVNKGYAYVAHIFSKGFSVIDVRDPRKPNPVNYIPSPPNTWSIHLQQHENLLLVINAKDMFAQPELADERNYYKGKADFHSHDEPVERNWTAGMAVYDISKPTEPKRIGFMPVDGGGLHRIWYVGGRWAYASALLDGFTDYILITIDMEDPTKPRMAGKHWLPGMNAAAGEKPKWPLPTGRFGLHHPIVHGDTAYCSWRDAGLAVVDVADRANPNLVVHKTWYPPLSGGTHNALPLPDRDLLIVVDEAVLDSEQDGRKYIWVFNNQVRNNPISIATFPIPTDHDYVKLGGHFGPHNIHENRPNGFQSSELIFATYQNAGLRAYNISNPFQPIEVAACVPPAPEKLVDPRPNRPRVLHLADVFVDKEGLCYVSDFSGAGFYVIEYKG
jgi:hypothetical protein